MVHESIPIIKDVPLRILDVGSADVNGNLRDAISASAFGVRNYTYVGLDMDDQPNVDIIIAPNSLARDWPLERESFDFILSSSCFEHDDFFWETFSHMAMLLRPGGFIYLQMPSNAPVHRFPVDNWRFNTDGANALAKWANKANKYTEDYEKLHVVFSALIPGDEDANMIFYKPPLIAGLDVTATIFKLKDYYTNYFGYAVLNSYSYYVANELSIPSALMKANRQVIQNAKVATAVQQSAEQSGDSASGGGGGGGGDTIIPKIQVPMHVLMDIPIKYVTYSPYCRMTHFDPRFPKKNLLVRHLIFPEKVVSSDGAHCHYELQLVIREIDLRDELSLGYTMKNVLQHHKMAMTDAFGLYDIIKSRSAELHHLVVDPLDELPPKS